MHYDNPNHPKITLLNHVQFGWLKDLTDEEEPVKSQNKARVRSNTEHKNYDPEFIPNVAQSRPRNKENVKRIAIKCSIDEFKEDELVPRPFVLQNFDVTCPHCGAIRWKNEHVTWPCCLNGRVKLPAVPALPPELQSLFHSKSAKNRFFLEHIRKFNSCLAFSSLKCTNISLNGPRTFRVCGSVHHLVGPLQKQDNAKSTFSQIYFYEPDDDKRIQIRSDAVGLPISNYTAPLTLELENIIKKYNNHYKRFHTHIEQVRKIQARGGDIPQNLAIVSLGKMHMNPSNHVGRYNDPTVNDVSGIIRQDVAPEPSTREFVVHLRSSGGGAGLQFHPVTNRYYDSLHYVLLFPTGCEGWHPNIKLADTRGLTKKNPTVTIRQFYNYHLQLRKVPSPLFFGRKLFLQYIVDVYSKLETCKLNFIKNNQSKLRADLYNCLTDNIAGGGEGLARTGKRVILPSSFKGGNRHMQQLYQDAMAIQRRVKRFPSLFITMTTNSNWSEILDVCKRFNIPKEFFPMLRGRVFRLKYKELIKDVVSGKAFGECLAHIASTEFQKRGKLLINLPLINHVPRH